MVIWQERPQELLQFQVSFKTKVEIFSLELNNDDKYIIMGSDGVWEFITNQEISEIVWPFYKSNMAEQAADAIVNEARKRWEVEDEAIDDITCIVVFFDNKV